MTHSYEEVALFFHKKEMEMTEKISDILIENNFKIFNIEEKVHIIIGLVDNTWCYKVEEYLTYSHVRRLIRILLSIIFIPYENFFQTTAPFQRKSW